MPLPPPPPSPLRSRGYSPVLSDESGGCGAGPFPVATSVHPATIIRTNAAASRLRRFIYYDPFDQAGVVILDVPDAGVDGPARHSPGRVGREQGLEAVRVGRLLPQPRRPCPRGKNHRHPVVKLAHSSLGVVVVIAKLRTLSPPGERQVSHNPASAISYILVPHSPAQSCRAACRPGVLPLGAVFF